MSDLEALRFLANRFEAYCQQSGSVMVNPLRNLAELRRLNYQRVFALAYRPNDEAELYDHIVHCISPQREDELIQAVKDFLPAGAGAKAGEILVDVPLKRRLRTAGAHDALAETHAERGTRTKLWVCCRGQLTKQVQRWLDITEYSPLAGRMGEVEDHSGRKIRIFLASELLDRLSLGARPHIEAELTRHVKAATHGW
jgi:hypothetical protein